MLTRRRAILFAFALALSVATAAAQGLAPFFPAGGGPIDTGPAPSGLRAIDAASCGECHADHLGEWRSSAHAVSFTNAVFRAEFEHRHLASCSACHAPRGEAAGIDCAVCHVRDGAVLNPTVSGRAPHASRVAAELGDQRACAPCHEFDFDGQPGDRLQRTVSEWTASPHAGTACQTCHLPPRAGHRAHDFPGGLDAALLRDAIRVRSASARAENGITRVELELEADRAGHAVPTGDIFRRLEVRVWPAGRPARARSSILARRFRVSGARWEEIADRRVPASGTRDVAIELDGEVDRVEYAIDLWRVPSRRAERERWPVRDVRRRLEAGALEVDRAR
jgi:hypothetical protein